MGSAPPGPTAERPAATRRSALHELQERARDCVRCPQLAANRTTVVFGTGDPDAALMLVGEAPGQNEDRQGLPLVGSPGRLLVELLGEVGIAREDVYIANVLQCRPPHNRDPLAEEIAHCHDFLAAQVALVRPRVVCSLGNFATKVLRQDPTGIKPLHGTPEVRAIGPTAVRLLPVIHPAAALYQASNLALLRADLARLPELLALPAPPPPEADPPSATGDGAPAARGTGPRSPGRTSTPRPPADRPTGTAADGAVGDPDADEAPATGDQLGLF